MVKRNPCRVKKVEYHEDGVHIVERRGYAQERKTIDGVEQVFVMEGGIQVSVIGIQKMKCDL